MDIILYNKIRGAGFNMMYLNNIMVSLEDNSRKEYLQIHYRCGNSYEIQSARSISPDFNKRLCTVLSRKSL